MVFDNEKVSWSSNQFIRMISVMMLKIQNS